MAFALTAAHNYHQSQMDWFSVEYLFYHAVQREPGRDPKTGLTFLSAEHALRHYGQPSESDWPYENIEPVSLHIPPPITKTWTHDSSSHVHGSSKKVLSDVVSQPIVLGVKLTDEFFRKPNSPFMIDDTEVGFGGHAVLGVGSGTDNTGNQWILIRNSWGAHWGDSGDAWVSSRYLDENLIGHMRLE